MKSKLLLITVCLLSFFYCKGQSVIIKYKNNNNLEIEKIDISSLNNLKETLKNSKKKELVLQDNGKEIQIFLLADNVYYTEIEGSKKISISGSTLNGFIKKETETGSPIERRSEFYPNGNLKRTGQVEFINNKVEHAIGVWHLYDENGKLIETTKYNSDDSLFLFTIEDVQAYIKNENLNDDGNINVSAFKSSRVVVNGKIRQEAEWVIRIYEGMDIRRIILDGKTGRKLNETVKRIEK